MTILKSRLIPELSKVSGYLDWIEGVRTVLEKVINKSRETLLTHFPARLPLRFLRS